MKKKKKTATRFLQYFWFGFFFILVLRPVKIISLILGRVNHKVGWKWEIPEKKHLITRKLEPTAVSDFRFGNAIDNMLKTGTADLMKHASKIYFWNLACVIYVTWTSIGFCPKSDASTALFNNNKFIFRELNICHVLQSHIYIYIIHRSLVFKVLISIIDDHWKKLHICFWVSCPTYNC